jgi:hypothetical protein
MHVRMHKKHTYSSILSIQIFSFRRDGIGIYFFFLPGRNWYLPIFCRNGIGIKKSRRDGTHAVINTYHELSERLWTSR